MTKFKSTKELHEMLKDNKLESRLIRREIKRRG